MALPNKKRKIFDGRYEVVSIVGRGNDSVVYHARHAASPTQEVALKVLISQKDRPSVTDRLRKEALTLVSCRHRYVVRLDDFHSVGDLCYLSMEYAPEGDLRKFAAKTAGQLDAAMAEKFLAQSLEALDFVHKTGVIHRDMKPDNILVMNESEIRLADFGIALLPGDEPSIEELQKGVGSFSYMPPETLEGIRYDLRSDLYALGVSFYELISGGHPFDKAPLAMQMNAREDKSIVPLSQLAPNAQPSLVAVISRLMRFNADDRYQSAKEALRALQSGVETTGASESAPELRALASEQQSSSAPASTSPEPIFDFDEELEPVDLGPENADQPEETKVQKTANAPTPITDADRQRSSLPTEKLSVEQVQEIVSSIAAGSAAPQVKPAAPAPETAPDQFAPRPKSSIDPRNLAVKGKPQPKQPQPAQTAQQKAPAHTSPSPSREDRVSIPRVDVRELWSKVPHRFRPFVLALLMALGVIIAAQVLRLFPSKSTSTNSTSTTVNDQVPTFEGGKLNFPQLPAGFYSGEIEGILPGTTSPLTFISLPEKKMLAVIIGIEGWSPSMVSLADATPENRELTIRSNGIIMKLSGESGTDQIEGTFQNVVTGDSGRWIARPVKE